MKTFAKFRWHLQWGHSGPWLMAKRRSRSWCWGQSITTWSWGPWGQHTVTRRGHTITTESWGPWGPLLLTKMQSWDLWGPLLFIRRESCDHCGQHQVDVNQGASYDEQATNKTTCLWLWLLGLCGGHTDGRWISFVEAPLILLTSWTKKYWNWVWLKNIEV